MAYQDYIERRLELLRKLIERISGLIKRDEVEIALSTLHKAYNQMPFSREDLFELDVDLLIRKNNKNGISFLELESMISIIVLDGDICLRNNDPESAKLLFEKSMHLLSRTSEQERLYSFNLEEHIKSIARKRAKLS